ncbi:MAG: hypothetical protein JRJ14_05870, partial [Deltaproteobacteria bacterium]|nr:hypothetical protein [Deltaproteobacteria bacterium]
DGGNSQIVPAWDEKRGIPQEGDLPSCKKKETSSQLKTIMATYMDRVLFSSFFMATNYLIPRLKSIDNDRNNNTVTTRNRLTFSGEIVISEGSHLLSHLFFYTVK